VDLGGWVLDDEPEVGAAGSEGTAPYIIPAGTIIEAGGFVVLYRSETGVALNNDGDEVRLLGPDGLVLDSFTYDTAERDGSWSRTVDGGGEWTLGYPPSPGRSNQPATPTPTATPYPLGIVLNEFLPAPRDVDWDGDGSANLYDEWIELTNTSGQIVDLGGWVLDDEPEGMAASVQGSSPYAIPAGTMIEPGGFLVFYRRETGVVLNNDGDEVRLLGPDGALLDGIVYDRAAGDGSWSRTVDGSGVWTDTYPPSPGGPNIPPPPTATPTVTPTRAPGEGPVRRIRISAETARYKYAGTRVIVEGQVTVVPPLFGRSMYIQDHTGGIMVSLYRGEFPPLVEGDWLEVRGRLSDYHGERRIWVTSAGDLRRTGSGPPVQPLLIGSGEVDEAHEGMLVQMYAPVVGFRGQNIFLDDGSGEARVYIRESVGFKRPWVELGEVWSVVGIVSQYVRSRPYVGGYRLLPRTEADLSNAPLLLPVTGGG
jgi:DNA/RNA endonuclease YhcR with UshA esterase domain